MAGKGSKRTRLESRLENLKKQGKKALVTFMTAGDPDLQTTAEMIESLEVAGADIIELGIPFSDPMADGPTIQLSSERAISSGTTLASILSMVREVRVRTSIPIILMGYLNPVHSYGYARFAADAADAGVDGVLFVDMPPEESAEFTAAARGSGLHTIFLLAPTSDEARIRHIGRMGSGFIYYVTVTGVTGARQQVSENLAAELDNLKKFIKLPVMAGFGISTPDQAATAAAHADGVVVGSAIVKLFEKKSGSDLKNAVTDFVGSLRRAIDA